MSLTINLTEKNSVVIVGLVGNLDTNTAPEAESQINEKLAAGTSKMIINLAEAKYVSSAGLRVFLATAKKMTAAGGAVKLCAPNEVVREILDISGFSTILDVKDTEEQALSDI